MSHLVSSVRTSSISSPAPMSLKMPDFSDADPDDLDTSSMTLYLIVMFPTPPCDSPSRRL